MCHELHFLAAGYLAKSESFKYLNIKHSTQGDNTSFRGKDHENKDTWAVDKREKDIFFAL
jgi:hypothetical protein